MPGLDSPRNFRQWMRWVERRLAEHDWRIAGIGSATGSSSGYAPPVSSLVPYAGTGTPGAEWLECDGSTFSSVTYPDLAAELGDTYGTHSGTSYFLPDLRRRFPRARDPAAGSGANVLGGSDGNALASRTTIHDHGIQSQAGHNHAAGSLVNTGAGVQFAHNTATGGSADRISQMQGNTSDYTHNHTISGDTANNSGHAHGGDTDPTVSADFPFLTVKYFIRALP